MIYKEIPGYEGGFIKIVGEEDKIRYLYDTILELYKDFLTSLEYEYYKERGCRFEGFTDFKIKALNPTQNNYREIFVITSEDLMTERKIRLPVYFVVEENEERILRDLRIEDNSLEFTLTILGKKMMLLNYFVPSDEKEERIDELIDKALELDMLVFEEDYEEYPTMYNPAYYFRILRNFGIR